MLEPDHRMLLSDALRPPPGMQLDHAVVTTFTLDLTTALAVPLAFAGARIAEDPDPVQLLEALRSSADRIDVFYQGGAVTVPTGGSNLVALLEDAVHPVRRPRPGHLFHPKVWALRFAGEHGERRFRLLVSSRNLTADRSWDVLLLLEGQPSRTIVTENERLSRFVAVLPSMADEHLDDGRAEAVRAMAQDLRRVQWELPEGVTEIAFHPIGLPGMRLMKPSELFAGSRHLVISPFVTTSWLEAIPWWDGGVLVSRKEELDRLPPEVLDGLDVYTLDAGALTTGDEEDARTPGQAGSLLQGLHAKTYWVEYGRRAYVYVGSANATGGAFGGNVEFLCELSGGRTGLGIENLVGECAPFRQLLAPYEPPDEPQTDPARDAGKALDELLIDVAELGFRAGASEDGDGWRLDVTSDRPLPDPSFPVTFSIAPFRRLVAATPVAPGEQVDAAFPRLSPSELTPFLVVRAETSAAGQTVTRTVAVQAVLTGGPEHRVHDILVDQIDTPAKFLRLLILMLGLAHGDIVVPDGSTGEDGGGRWATGSQGILELFAQTLATRPETLDALAGIVERLRASAHASNVLPDGWDALWREVWAARRALVDTEEPA